MMASFAVSSSFRYLMSDSRRARSERLSERYMMDIQLMPTARNIEMVSAMSSADRSGCWKRLS
ncbi:MAG TPA: hypothetical protein DCS42_05590 [Nitrospiraceae bacterium]|nr:hypothetical protein [Nitrospiraceae bacterium]